MKGYILIIATLTLIVSVLVTLNIFFQQTLQLEMAEQFNKQQLLLSSSIAENIGAYVNVMRKEALSFGCILSHTVIRDKNDFSRLTGTVARIRGDIYAHLGIMNRKGEILFYDGDKKSILPYSDRIHTEGKSLPFGRTGTIDSLSQLLIISPVYRMGKLEEILFLSIHMDELVSHFVRDIHTSNRGYASIIDRHGNLLYHLTQPEMIGKNIYVTDNSCMKCHKGFTLEKRMVEGKEGNGGRYIAPDSEDKVLAFSSVQVSNISWIVTVSAPYSEVIFTTKESMKLYSYLIISILTTTIIVSALLILFNRKRIEAEAIEERQCEMQKYAVELEEKVAERTAELCSEKEKLDTIVGAIGSGILLFDRNGIIRWANQTIRNMAGKDIIGRSCEEICAECEITGAYSSDESVETVFMSNLFGHKDRFFQVTTAPVRGENREIHGHIRLIQDVTEMKRMEEQMTNSEKLAAIGRLAAGIAHEIGNPLTSIFSYVQILREIEQDEFKKESLQTVYFHINRISEILKQLSGFTKMPVGEQKRCRVNEIIDSSVNLIQFDKKAREIEMIRDLSPDLPEIIADCNQLSQVFVNLILNAFDAMPQGGTLTVRSFVKGNAIGIEFQDSGTGIPKEDIMKIFDPFYTTKEKGTGLGLAVSYNIVKKINGVLSVESEIGKGTTFTITIPLPPENHR